MSSITYMGALCFCLLTLQNSALGLMMRYSRHVLHETYSIQTSVLVCELLKFGVAAAMVARTVGYDTRRSMVKFYEVMQSALPMAIPAVSYCLQNILAFVALQRLDAATFSVVNQLKILTSALFARLMLGRQSSWSRWRALTLLLLGVLLVQREPCPTCPSCDMDAIDATGEHAAAAARANSKTVSERAIGFAASLFVAIASGYAGIYFESHLRRPQSGGQPPMTESENLWRKNFQLSFWGIAINLIALVVTDAQHVSELGFFHGYSIITWITIMLSAFGGIMVGLVVQYTDTIVKGFATSFAIILTAFGSWLWFNLVITFHFCIGVACVIIASFNYNQPEAPSSLSSSAPSSMSSVSSSSSSAGSGMVSIANMNGSTVNDTLIHRQHSMDHNDSIELRRLPSGGNPGAVA